MGNKLNFSRCLSDSGESKFKNTIPPLLSPSMPCAHTVQSSYLNSTPPDVNYLIESIKSIKSSVHTSLDTVAPLKRKDKTEMCNLHLA